MQAMCLPSVIVTHTHTLFGFEPLTPLGARLLVVAGASLAKGKREARADRCRAQRPASGDQLLSGITPRSLTGKVPSKRGHLTPGQRRGEGEGRERQGGRAELGAAFQQEGAQVAPGRGRPPKTRLRHTRKGRADRSQGIARSQSRAIPTDKRGQSPRGPVAVRLSRAE